MLPPNRPAVCDRMNRATTPCLLPTIMRHSPVRSGGAPRASGRRARKRPRGLVQRRDQLFKGDNGRRNGSDLAQASLSRQRSGIFDEPICHYRSSRHRDYNFEPDGHHLCGLCNSLRFVRKKFLAVAPNYSWSLRSPCFGSREEADEASPPALTQANEVEAM